MLRKVRGPRKTDEEQGTKSEPRMEHGEEKEPENNLSSTFENAYAPVFPSSRSAKKGERETKGSFSFPPRGKIEIENENLLTYARPVERYYWIRKGLTRPELWNRGL